jgi:hypothetical protein
MRTLAKAFVPILLLAAFPAMAQSQGLTVKTGETWIFEIEKGQPVRARRVEAATKPGKGQVQVAVRSALGTAMSIGGNVPVSYNFRAELITGNKALAKRACTLPANGKPAFEFWPEKADAVRISNFKPAPKGGSCP